jgi:hypothetical protein
MTRFVKIWSNGVEDIQIAQLVVTDVDGKNVALGKTCSASSTYESSTSCINAIDGTIGVRSFPNLFHSKKTTTGSLEWFLLDLGASFLVSSVTYYNRDDFQARAVDTQLQLLDANTNVLAQRLLDSSAVQAFTFSLTVKSLVSVAYSCETDFEGGGWVLVRRVKSGSLWHPATDDLRGRDVYGLYGSSTSPSIFSVEFSSWVTQSTDFLFITGNGLCVLSLIQDLLSVLLSMNVPLFLTLNTCRRQVQVVDCPFLINQQWGCQLSRSAARSDKVKLLCKPLFARMCIIVFVCIFIASSFMYSDTATWYWSASAARDPALFM